MKRAQSMAQAAWRRPSLRMSSWSCMGPRQRTTIALSNSKEKSPGSATKTETSEALLDSSERTTTTTTIETIELPESSAGTIGWTSEIECSYSDEIVPDVDEDDDVSDGEDLMGHNRHEDRMTEVELWQQLEQELYDRTEGEDADVAKEIREEEAAAMAEVSNGQPESSTSGMNEAHRFFPAGKIMHIVFLPPESDDADCETDGSPTSSGSNDGEPEEIRIGIFQTPRSLYSKLRLSQTMIGDHFMPVYRRQIEKLITELEKEESSVGEVVL